MNYTKQANLLIQRGLIVSSKEYLISKLSKVSYYRLSSYIYHFKKNDGSDNIIDNTNFDFIWRIYAFDRQLRFLILDVIERFEIAIRTQIVNLHALRYGPFGYLQKCSLPKISDDDFSKLLLCVDEDTKRKSKEYFITHYFQKYSESNIPIWMVGEIISFGSLVTIFNGLENNLKKEISDLYDIEYSILANWLKFILYTRNLCAHHMPIWSRYWQYQPKIPTYVKPDKDDLWHVPINIRNDNLFGVLSVLRFLQKIIAQGSKWKNRLFNLFSEYPDIPKDKMGFPENWLDSPIWKD